MTHPDPSFAVKDVPSALVRQTLLDRELVRPVDRAPIRMLPWLNVVALGGRSIIDRGPDTLGPVVDELRRLLPEHRMLILAGPGIRARHSLGVGLDLGLPTGVLSSLASVEAEQNGHMVAALLAADGVSYVPHATVAHQLATHLTASRSVVSNGYPPYGLYEFPPELGKIPPHRTDAGALLLADAYGAASTILVQDVDGVYTTDPRDDNPTAEFIPRISASELAARDLETLPVDRMLLDLLGRTKHVTQVQIVNGQVAGAITRALRGEHVGTIIDAG